MRIREATSESVNLDRPDLATLPGYARGPPAAPAKESARIARPTKTGRIQASVLVRWGRRENSSRAVLDLPIRLKWFLVAQF